LDCEIFEPSDPAQKLPQIRKSCQAEYGLADRPAAPFELPDLGGANRVNPGQKTSSRKENRR
jgi:hypothetical protein